MATIKSNSQAQVSFSITFKLTPEEAAALEAIAGYGHEAFLKVFYEKMGKAYLQPYETDMINLFKKIKAELPTEIAKIKEAKKVINEALQKFN